MAATSSDYLVILSKHVDDIEKSIVTANGTVSRTAICDFVSCTLVDD
jgi:hypothetical protein